MIIGNPPYSEGQASANDNNQNIDYPCLDKRITDTYVEKSNAKLSKNNYNSYIRAIRWASDRIGQSGVIGFVTNAGFLKANTTDGLRKCLVEEFSSIYVFHLRGGIRGLSGDLAKREGQNVFDIVTGVAISVLVKNPKSTELGKISFYDIGDYLSRNDKLEAIKNFSGIDGITKANLWQVISSNHHGDWIGQRDDDFEQFIILGNKKDSELKLFENYSLGVATNRDAWCYNSSKRAVRENITRMIDVYNQETERFNDIFGNLDKKVKEAKINEFVEKDAKKISWTVNLKKELANNNRLVFEESCITTSIYRPFFKQWQYFNRKLNERVLQMPRIFPDSSVENLVIILHGVGEILPFTVLISNVLPDLHTLHGGQCFPLYLYEGNAEIAEKHQGDLLVGIDKQRAVNNTQGYTRKDAITDEGLAYFHAAYPSHTITKEDVFYYVYGLLHSPDYRERYADNLSKELPRIPCVKTFADFQAFSQAGRDLAEMHLNYETVDMYPAQIAGGSLLLKGSDYRVEKMKYGKKGKDKDLSTLIYNDKITVTGIPLAAYDYVVNGKPALDWVVERQCVSTHKDSGIVNDANDWAIETMQNPKYPLELFLRVVTVSLETMKIVNALPSLKL